MIKSNQDFNNENVYIGSCCNYTRRKSQHKHSCNIPNHKGYNLKLYQTIRDNGGWDEWVMLKLHDFPCNEKYELNLEERRVIDLYKSKLNMLIPTRTKKKYYEDNKEHINEKHKKYYEDNKEKIKEYFKEYNKKYYEENKEKESIRKKKYYDENKEKESIRKKKYYEDNKEKINEKITCECGSIVKKRCIARHRKSLKHILFLDNTKIY